MSTFLPRVVEAACIDHSDVAASWQDGRKKFLPELETLQNSDPQISVPERPQKQPMLSEAVL